MACDKNRAIPIVAPMFNPNERDMIKYSPPPSTFWLVADNEIIGVTNIRHYLNE